MFKKKLFNQDGLTFIELMIAIGLIIFISALSVVYIQGDIKDDVNMATDQLTADIRYTRNLAASRTAFDFSAITDPTVPQAVKDLGNVYPPGGYGVYVHRPTDTYQIFVDSGIDGGDGNSTAEGFDDTDIVIKSVTIENNLLEIGDANHDNSVASYFTFETEKNVVTNLISNTYSKYQIEVDFPAVYPEKGYRGVLTLGERSDDGYIWASLGKGYSEYSASPPPPPEKDPVEKFQME